MATPVIQSSGSVSGAGAAGQGRNTLVLGETVTLSDTNGANSGASYAWAFRDTPIGSAAALVSAGSAVSTFVPDTPGSYWISCTVGGTDASTEILAVPLVVTGARIPAFEEDSEYDAGGNTKGWHESQSNWMSQVDNLLGTSATFLSVKDFGAIGGRRSR